MAVEPIPQRAEARSPREVREQGRLAVAGLGDNEQDAVMNLCGEPVEEPVPGQRLVTERWALNLRRLDRVASDAAVVPSVLVAGRGGWAASGNDGNGQLGLQEAWIASE